jgi:hypothetical protein
MSITLESIKEKMLGHTFGKLTILKYVGKSEKGENLWYCRCSCGETVISRTSNVDKPKSACRKCKIQAGPKAEYMKTYLLGQKFGKLDVVSYEGRNKRGFGLWKCQCDCGNIIVTLAYSLATGSSQSCGCTRIDAFVARNTTHGLSKHPLYQVWWQIKERCYNPNCPSYQHYGGDPERVISMCDEWRYDFTAFYNWAMSKGYCKGLTVERKNNNGNYEPSNCDLVPMQVQGQNTRRTKMSADKIESVRNDLRTHRVIALEYGVDESTISRIKARATWSNISN